MGGLSGYRGNEIAVVAGAAVRVYNTFGLTGHCLGSIRSTSSKGSRSRSMVLKGVCVELKVLLATRISNAPVASSFSELLVQLGMKVSFAAPTRSICSPSIGFTGYHEVACDSQQEQQHVNKIDHIFVNILRNLRYAWGEKYTKFLLQPKNYSRHFKQILS